MRRLLGRLALLATSTTICALRPAFFSTFRLASAQRLTAWVPPRRTPRTTSTGQPAAHKSSVTDFLYPRPEQQDAMDYAKAMTQVRASGRGGACKVP